MVLTNIKENLPFMYQNFRKIGTYILDNENSVAFSSIYSLSHDLNVSTATLVRFAKKLGYSGYQSFKKALQEEIHHKLQPYEKVSLSRLGELPEEQRLQKLIQNEYNNLRNTLNALELSQLELVVDALKKCRSIYIAGFGITRHFAQILQTTLLYGQAKDVFCISGSISDFYPQLRNFTSDDLMFILTFPPYSAEILEVANVVKKQKGKLCLFTDSANCPIYSDADIIIKCVTNSLLMSNSFVGVISAIHIIIHMLLLSLEECKETIRAGIEMEQEGYSLIAGSRETTQLIHKGLQR